MSNNYIKFVCNQHSYMNDISIRDGDRTLS